MTSETFRVTETGALVKPTTGIKRRVLVTGAAGRIGSYFSEHGQENYNLRLMVRGDEEGIDRLNSYGDVVTCDLADLAHLKELCETIDTVVHLAGVADPSAPWNDLLEANIKGTYNIFVAALAAGCRRVIYASSIHAIAGYPADVQVKTNDPVNPGDLYGVTKCFGEALGRYMAEQQGLSTICLRIGAFQPVEAAQQADALDMMDHFVSHRDLNQLIQRCIEADHVRFAILHGSSDNRFKRMDISDARQLVGYAPQDDLTDLNPQLQPLNLRETVQMQTGHLADAAAMRR